MVDTVDVPAAGREGPLTSIPFHWLLFAAYPVLFLYSQNLGEITPDVVVVPLLVILGAATVGMLVLSRILGDARRAAVIVTASVLILLLFGEISDNLHRIVPQLWLRLLICGVVLLLVVIIALRLRGSLGTATLLLNIVSIVLVTFAVIPIGQQVLGRLTTGPGSPDGSVQITAQGPGTTRDIWWVIFDRYGSDASIEDLYGITDNDLGPWLADRGFHLLGDARANYVRTTLSLASTLNLTQLDALAARMGPDSTDYQPVHEMILDHPVGRFLQSQGYRFTQLGSWFPQTRNSDIADSMLRPGVAADFGDLTWNATVFPAILRILSSDDNEADANRAQVAAVYQWEQFDRLCRQSGPSFVFAHVLLPHPPYVFEADGTFVPKGTTSSYDDQMRYTNTHIRDLVTCLLDRPADQQPIIVLQADEGPYPPRYGRDQIGFDWSTATADELTAKFGILDAMYLPGLPESASPPPSGMTSVNTFRYLFDVYFGADLPLLPDRTYTSPKLKPYDLTDVTDRFPSRPLAPVVSPSPAA